MVDFLIGVDGGGTATRAWLARRDGGRLTDAADGPAAGALTLIRNLVEQVELHPA